MELTVEMGCESIRRATAGDSASLSRLAESVHQRVYPYIYRVILDTDLSADLTQDTLVRVLSSLGRLRDVERFWPWVYTIASNTTRQHLRVRRRAREIPFSAIDPKMLQTHLASRNEPASHVSDEELKPQADLAVARLGRRLQVAWSLRMIEGRSYEEIADRLGCSKGAARCLVCRARRDLRRELSICEGRVSRSRQTG